MNKNITGYKYIFGPVLSRRLGISLGIDLVPAKTCSLDCLYCESGKTTDLTIKRKKFFPEKEIISEIERYMSLNAPPDVITFSGAGEPTLNSSIGEIIRFIKKKYKIPVSVLTNATLIPNKNIQKDLLSADIVMPSLDSALEKSFIKINRPAKGIDINEIILSLEEFKRKFKGEMNLEIFLLEDINDSDEDIKALKDAADKIKPDSILLNTLDRPGTVDWIKPVPSEKLERIKEQINYSKTSIIAKAAKKTHSQNIEYLNEETVLGTISRRPSTIEDLYSTLGASKKEIESCVENLKRNKKIKSKKLERGVFYFISEN